jgi:hypothetical protein
VLIRESVMPASTKKTRDIKELLEGGSAQLTSLRNQSRARSATLAKVRAALAPELAGTVTVAGIEAGRLTVGVCGAAWASRLRYAAEELRQNVGHAMGVEIHSVRIRVVPG